VLLRPGDWKSAGREFLEEIIPAYLDSKDVFSLQFGYYDVGSQGDIIDPEKGFFAESPERYEISDLLNFQTQHPDKKLVYWTTALSRSIGTQESTDFNNQLRRYVQEHDGILLDLADIESYNPEGIPCFDNRDGIPYCDQNTGKCENYPDDNKSFPAICQDYTTEVDAGHLGSVSAGKIRLAKAFWVLMARLAGWTPQL
jgi:hypothetical protein